MDYGMTYYQDRTAISTFQSEYATRSPSNVALGQNDRKLTGFTLKPVVTSTSQPAYHTRKTISIKPMMEGCSAKTDIVFLKTHKCGSSTVQNILFRYGDKYNLTFATPKTQFVNNMGWPNYFDKRFLLEVPWNRYNIFAFHTKFKYKSISSIMSRDSVYITILRDPVNQFESVFSYYRIDKMYKIQADDISQALRVFISNPLRFYEKTPIVLAKNPMLFDLGMEISAFDKKERVLEKIRELNSTFDFVMIAEQMDQSLILLRHLLCWDLDDVIYFSLNARLSSERRGTVTQLMANRTRNWNAGDVILYDHFYELFQRRVLEFGKAKMADEVKKLKQKKFDLYKYCVNATAINLLTNQTFLSPGIDINSFLVNKYAQNNSTCVRLTQLELSYTEIIRDKLLQNINTYNSNNRHHVTHDNTTHFDFQNNTVQ
ncbi:galactosylceramide sulfotransferase-like [Saccoglossus kowalevskii]|uniref:Galactosylceramide sulfotransferase-like n=1 Tax=Saccoglossus kowalevskii TaxID=10224 RepID=A0ABM0GWH6_SACKO|nr:PREDICTED: galactosylceramide sulfotransferase-like [Saccoglossus kowalevskii]